MSVQEVRRRQTGREGAFYGWTRSTVQPRVLVVLREHILAMESMLAQMVASRWLS